ncbi:MAG: alanyl-tRNA editing protein [Candidatus Caldarchaeum sp.]|nr:alanyl-tRNA editing protein [Candidatus Caldarchaeum sp.]
MEHGKTKLLYLDDSYVTSFSASVLEAGDEWVLLDQTYFHPRGGGLVSDVGIMKFAGGEAKVVEASFGESGVVHRLEGPVPAAGSFVECSIDWEKRYRLMRLHTGLHVLAAHMVQKTGALITGNNISFDNARVDFSLENFDRTLMEQIVQETNKKLEEGHAVKIYYMEREKVLNTPGMVKLAGRLPPDIPILRIVEIEGIDIQADGGPHVHNTSEVGQLFLSKLENKGKTNRRMYFTVTP